MKNASEFGNSRLLEEIVIPTNASARTESDRTKALHRFNRRLMVDAYKSVGLRNEAWDAQALDFLEDAAKVYSCVPQAPSYEDLIRKGTPLVGAGCEDPMVRYCLGRAEFNPTNPASAAMVVSAAQALVTSKYARARAMIAAQYVAGIYRDQGFRSKRSFEQWRDTALRMMTESLRNGDFSDGEQRVFMTYLNDEWDRVYIECRDTLWSNVQSVTNTDPWIRDVLKGKHHIDKAWQARGSGFADTVSEEGWNGFYENLDLARKALTSALALHPEYPEAATEMITVTMGHPADEQETTATWFNRAVQAQMDYAPAYNKYAFSLYPRWGGSKQAMHDFGVQCLETLRFDTDIPFRFFSVQQEIMHDLDSAKVYWHREQTWTLLKKMFEGYIAQTDGAWRSWYQSLYAATAWERGDFTTSRRLLDLVGSGLSPYVFQQYYGTTYDTARVEIMALTGPAGEAGRKARDLILAGKKRDALTLYETILTDATLDTDSRIYFTRTADNLKKTLRMAEGERQELRPNADFAGWKTLAGNWSIEPDGRVLGASTRDGMQLLCDQVIDRDCEIEGELEFGTNPYKFKFSGGLFLGFSDKWPGDFVSILFYRAESNVCICSRFDVDAGLKFPAPIGGKNTFVLRVWEGRLQMIINGDTVFSDLPCSNPVLSRRLRVGLGAYVWYPGSTVRFSALKVRSLSSCPWTTPP